MPRTKEENYLLLKALIVNEEIMLLPRKSFSYVRATYVYARCGKSIEYFEKAYQKGDVILGVVEDSKTVMWPDNWENALVGIVKEKE